jgi:hypothetical protein
LFFIDPSTPKACTTVSTFFNTFFDLALISL